MWGLLSTSNEARNVEQTMFKNAQLEQFFLQKCGILYHCIMNGDICMTPIKHQMMNKAMLYVSQLYQSVFAVNFFKVDSIYCGYLLFLISALVMAAKAGNNYDYKDYEIQTFSDAGELGKTQNCVIISISILFFFWLRIREDMKNPQSSI